MIIVTRLNGPPFAVNPDLIERAESNPDTVVTLVDGAKYVIAESLEQLIERIRDYRASIITAATAQELALKTGGVSQPGVVQSGLSQAATSHEAGPARRDATVVPLIQRER